MSILTGFILDVLKDKAERGAMLAALEHCLHEVRDGAEFKDLLAEAARRIGCEPGRMVEVLNAIAGAAHDLRL